MADLVKVSLAGLPQATYTTATAAAGETAPSTVTIGTSSGLVVTQGAYLGFRDPYLKLTQVAFAGATYCEWPLGGSYTSYGIRFYWAALSNITTTMRMFWGMNSATGTGWRLEAYSGGRVALINSANGTIELSAVGETLSGATFYRFEIVYNGTTLTCRVFAGESTTMLFDIGGNTSATMTHARFGALNESFTNPIAAFDDLLITDQASYPGPWTSTSSGLWVPKMIAA